MARTKAKAPAEQQPADGGVQAEAAPAPQGQEPAQEVVVELHPGPSARQVRGTGLGYATAHLGTAGVTAMSTVGSAYGLGGMAVVGGVTAGGAAVGYAARRVRITRTRRTTTSTGGRRVAGTGRRSAGAGSRGLAGRRAAAGRALGGSRRGQGLLGGKTAGQRKRGLLGSRSTGPGGRRVAGTKRGRGGSSTTGRRGLFGSRRPTAGRGPGRKGSQGTARKGLFGGKSSSTRSGRKGLLGGSGRSGAGRKGLLGGKSSRRAVSRRGGSGPGRHRATTKRPASSTSRDGISRKVRKELGKRLFGRRDKDTKKPSTSTPTAPEQPVVVEDQKAPRLAVSKGRRLRGGTALGGEMGHINDTAESVITALDRSDISSARKLDALFADIAVSEQRLADAKRRLAGRIAEEFPADPSVSEHVYQSAGVQSQLSTALSEVRALFRRVHNNEWERLEAPRRNEQAWDHQNNQE